MELKIESEVIEVTEPQSETEFKTGRTNMVETKQVTTEADAPVKVRRTSRKEEADLALFKPKTNPARTRAGQAKDHSLPPNQIHNILVTKIFPNPHDARQSEDTLEEITDLKASIVSNGIIEPLIVRPSEDGTFMLVAGHRRWKAAKAVGITTVPCIVRALDDSDTTIQGLISNIQRKDLHPVDLIRALDSLAQETAKELEGTQESKRTLVHNKVAEKLGKKVSWVNQYIRYRHIPKEVLDELSKKADITMNNIKDIYERDYKQKEHSKDDAGNTIDSEGAQAENPRIDPALAYQPSLIERRTHVVPATYIPSPVFGAPPVIEGEVESTETLQGQVENIDLTEEQKEGLVKQAKNPPLRLIQNERHTRYIASRDSEPFAAIYIQWLKHGDGSLEKAIFAAELFLQDAYALKRREAELNANVPNDSIPN